MKKLTKESKVKTRDGYPARIICDDRLVGYPIVALVNIGHREVTRWYTNEGIDDCQNSNFDLIEVSAYDDFRVDDPVMVRNQSYPWTNYWTKRHFAGVDSDGRVKVFSRGYTSFTSVLVETWEECRRPTEAELKGGNNEAAHAR